MAAGILVGIARMAGKQLIKTGAKEGAKAGAKEGAKQSMQSLAQEGLEKLGKAGFEKVLGKAGEKLFENISKAGFDKVATALKSLAAGKLDDAGKALLKDIFKDIPLGREGLKLAADLLFPVGGRKAGAILSNLIGGSAFSKPDSGM
jgi:hypothetical protein